MKTLFTLIFLGGLLQMQVAHMAPKPSPAPKNHAPKSPPSQQLSDAQKRHLDTMKQHGGKGGHKPYF